MNHDKYVRATAGCFAKPNFKLHIQLKPGYIAHNNSNTSRRVIVVGVYDAKDCDHPVNHAVSIIGYGTDRDDGDYWLVKNE